MSELEQCKVNELAILKSGSTEGKKEGRNGGKEREGGREGGRDGERERYFPRCSTDLTWHVLLSKSPGLRTLMSRTIGEPAGSCADTPFGSVTYSRSLRPRERCLI